MKFNLEDLLCSYQAKISLYDKQSWETTVEQRILRGLSYSPRKTAKLKTNLIDVDLVRGSTFPKAKPQSDVWLAGLQGILKIIFCPIYYRWWIKETSSAGFCFILSTYGSVFAALIIFLNFHHNENLKCIPGFEVLLPVFLLILLSIIYSQMISTRRKGYRIPLSYKGKVKSYYSHKNDRRLKSSRRNKSKSPSKSGEAFKSKSTKKDCQYPLKEKKIYKVPNRSFSEDLRPLKSYLKDNRSASEADINLHSLNEFLPSIKLEAAPDKLLPDSTPNIVEPPLEECHLRFRGSEASPRSPEQDEKNEQLRKFSSLTGALRRREANDDLEQTSELGSEDESCQADCESPDENVYSLWKTKLHGCISSKQKPLSGSHFSPRRSLPKLPGSLVEHSNSSCDSEQEHQLPTQRQFKHKHYLSNWIGVTTNSEDPSYSSESDADWDEIDGTHRSMEPIDWHIQGAPAAVISTNQVADKEPDPPSNTVYLVSSCFSCKIWEGADVKKVDLSVLDISSAVISRVDSLRHTSNYFRFGLIMSVILSLVPSLYRELMVESVPVESNQTLSYQPAFVTIMRNHDWASVLVTLSFYNRLVLATAIFFLLSVAERTFKLRFLYAKHFCYLTSARRARKYDLPHFRLNKVINIKSWLSIRSCLKNRGPQHSIDVIVSATFITTLILVFYLGVEAIKDEEERATQPLHNCELFVWCFSVSIYLIRFMTLGALINKKYSNPSVLITEQINMYLHMEQNPQKKDKLMLANNVLKLVSVLLKELDSPFKISGLSANTLLYNLTKFGILSACSGVLSNLLGFKLKLHNIKFK